MTRRRSRKLLLGAILGFFVVALVRNLLRSHKSDHVEKSISWFWEERPHFGVKSFVHPFLSWPAWFLSSQTRIRDYFSWIDWRKSIDETKAEHYFLDDVSFVVKPFLLLVNATDFKLRWVLTRPISLNVRCHVPIYAK